MVGDRLDAMTRLAAGSISRRSTLGIALSVLSAIGRDHSSGLDEATALSQERKRRAERRSGQISIDRKKKRKKKHKCRAPARRCGQTCHDLTSDSGHCGACHTQCASRESCVDGACQAELCITSCTTSACGGLPASCPLFPAGNIWNTRVDGLDPVGDSDDYMASIGRNAGLHADFGSGLYEDRPIGIPYVAVPGSQPHVAIHFGDFANESDPGPYPVPDDAPIEGGSCPEGDRHVLIVETDSCTLYELYHARPRPDGSWGADSGVRYDLGSNTLRPAGWTSADAAGLPILPGLVRFEEVAAGAITHALRFTAATTRNAYVWPARHEAGSTNSTGVPRMGQRFRLRAEFDISGFSADNQVILTALQRYGMMLADNGGNWFLSGAPDERWDNDDLRALRDGVHGQDFEAVDCSPLMVDPDSGEAAPAP